MHDLGHIRQIAELVRRASTGTRPDDGGSFISSGREKYRCHGVVQKKVAFLFSI